MDRVRYECRLSTGGNDMQFWCDELQNVMALVVAVASGAQTRHSMRLVVVDTANGGRASLKAETCLGFPAAVESMLAAMEATQARPVRDGDGRDVVVEVCFAAHDATLTECRTFAQSALAVALDSYQQHPAETRASFSHNGEGLGDAWFQ